MTKLWFAEALLPGGWAKQVRVTIEGGRISRVEAGVSAAPGDQCHGTALPGLPNLHSHAFQRLMAGLAEGRRDPHGDDFWSWRELMYALVAQLQPEDLTAVATLAFVEMLEAGFTRVGEFHYLHHQPDGSPYDEPARMGEALVEAACESGIALTLLPVFYAHAGFGGVAPKPQQRRFISSIDGFERLHAASQHALSRLGDAVLGIAPHSLRAVTPNELAELLAQHAAGPVHIHVAEQVGEVTDCLAWSGKRPVEWLFAHHDITARWCLVHATHMTETEMLALASSGAVAGLCPITEANLGDGLFPAEAFLTAGGRFGIGSDSNVRIDAAEEMRLLEYGQRLVQRRRGILADGAHSNGRRLVEMTLAGGGRALGSASALEAGAPADIVALAPDPFGSGDRALDRWIFGNGRVDAVWRAGRQRVAGGRHHARAAAERRFLAVANRLLASI